MQSAVAKNDRFRPAALVIASFIGGLPLLNELCDPSVCGSELTRINDEGAPPR